eukprot:3565120-Rhodomonas_salina.1
MLLEVSRSSVTASISQGWFVSWVVLWGFRAVAAGVHSILPLVFSARIRKCAGAHHDPVRVSADGSRNDRNPGCSFTQTEPEE